jgi:plasmid stabilization system protein ParE
MYEIKYLSIAKNDVANIALYIADNLNAPKAASDLLDTFDASIEKLREFPYICRIFEPHATLEYEYRPLIVRNYIVFYVIFEDKKIVEIHRVLYSKMDLKKLLK